MGCPRKKWAWVGARLILLIDGASENVPVRRIGHCQCARETHWTLSLFHEYGQQLERSVAEQLAMSMPTNIIDEEVCPWGECRAYQDIVFD